MTDQATPRIVLLPLDDRPVNVLLPADVAAVAGVILDVPPGSMLPQYRRRGRPEALGAWLKERASDPATIHIVVSIDMLLYGGLIASRTSDDTVAEVLARFDVLRQIKQQRSALPISAVSLVMRASNSYSAAEEPRYWSTYGKEIFELGAEVRRHLTDETVPPLSKLTSVPAEVVSDYSSRRLRNHVVNLNAMLLLENQTLDFLAITADDTATFSAGSAEQVWLRHWMRLLPAGREVLMYPGADEVGAVLVARALGASVNSRTSFEIVCAEPDGLNRVPSYENQPLHVSIARQIQAAGAEQREVDGDIVLVVHAPDPGSHNMFNGYPAVDDEAVVEGTVDLVRTSVAAGRRVALADVRYPNGSDACLVRHLAEKGLLEKLESFGGWNTAGNTLGSVIALSVAAALGRYTGHIDEAAARRALLTRLLDDFAYQSVIRTEIGPQLFPNQFPIDDDSRVLIARKSIEERMRSILVSTLPGEGWELSKVDLPWRRSFEVEIQLRRAEHPARPDAGRMQ